MDYLSILASDPVRRRAIEATGLVAPATRASAAALPDIQKTAMMSALARQAGGALDVVGKTIDTPGSIARGILAGDVWMRLEDIAELSELLGLHVQVSL